MAPTDVLFVSLGSTGGLRAADAELLGALRRAGAQVAVATAAPQRDVRTMALTDLVWARAARAAGRGGVGGPGGGAGAAGRAPAARGPVLDDAGGAAVAGAGRDPLRRAGGGEPA